MSLVRDQPDLRAMSSPDPSTNTINNIYRLLIVLALVPYTVTRATWGWIAGRQPSWVTLPKAILIALVRTVCHAWLRVALPLAEDEEAIWKMNPRATRSMKRFPEGSKQASTKFEVVSVPPLEKKYIRDFADVPWVQAVERPAWMVWCDTPEWKGGRGLEVAKEGEKVFLYFYGGGYVRGDPLVQMNVAATAFDLDVRMLSVNYRRCLSPETAMPGALLDAMAAYIYLVKELKFNPANIIVSGASAGGNLALLLSQYLHFVSLPQPGVLALSSPWVNLSNEPFRSVMDNGHVDWIMLQTSTIFKPAVFRNYKAEASSSKWFSPALATPEDWAYLKDEDVEVYTLFGGRELFADEIKVLTKTMKDAGVNVFLREAIWGGPGGLKFMVRKNMDGIHCGVELSFIPKVKLYRDNPWHQWVADLKTIFAGERLV